MDDILSNEVLKSSGRLNQKNSLIVIKRPPKKRFFGNKCNVTHWYIQHAPFRHTLIVMRIRITFYWDIQLSVTNNEADAKGYTKIDWEDELEFDLS